VTASGLRLAFAGTPDFAAVVLRALLASTRHHVAAVYTLPDRPAGRGRKLTTSPVGRLATEYRLPLLHPAKGRDIDPAKLAGMDAFVVVAFGLILPPAVLTAPRLGCINVHASLLPRWRGAAPIQRAILAGDLETGVTIMQMDTGLDTGDVLLQQTRPIEAGDTGAMLHDKLAVLGADCLLRTLDAMAEGGIQRRPQDHAQASYARKIEKAEASIDWSQRASDIVRKVRAFNPVPVARALVRGMELRIWEACETERKPGQTPGEITAAGPAGIDVAAGSGAVRILRLQQAGRQPVSARDFLNAHPAWRDRPSAES
jgi:methionyl-tRNA formyltransferase